MKHTFLLLALVLSIVANAITTVHVENQKIVLTQNERQTVLAPNGQEDSYYWLSLSPDGTRILYSSAHHGTCVCDLQGKLLHSLGRLNAPKWLDNENVSGMQEHYTDNDEIDYIDYFGINLSSQQWRKLTKEEITEFIRQENILLEEQRAEAAARAAERRATMGTSLQGLKFYINAGHGGHDPNDRSCWTIPVPQTYSNPNGYWESNSNLVKALALRDMLQAAGATVIMSRITNKSGIRDQQYYTPGTSEYNALAAGDDRDLSAIAQEANANHVDHFLSIHSNAQNTQTNYLLELYHGTDGNPTVAGSNTMATSSFNIQKQNPLTVWTSTATRVRGDITFYGNDPSSPTAGLGVLRPLTVPGFLSEGSFHDYPPETHRLCNADYCKLEALRFFQHFHRYFNRTLPQTATISGWVKSENELVDVLNQSKFYYVPNSDDQWLPLNGAKVVLINNAGQRIDSVLTDNWYNGIFAFYDLQPGTYSIEASLANYRTVTQSVTVSAEQIAGVKMRLHNTELDRTTNLNIYASGLNATQTNGTTRISYILNAPATSLTVKFYRGTTFVGQTAITGIANLSAGTHNNVTIDLSSLPNGNYRWALEASAEANGLSTPTEITYPNATEAYCYYLPQDVVVDNNFNSPYFGRVYVSESVNGASNGMTSASKSQTRGIYIYKPDMTFVNGQATALTGYAGGLAGTARQSFRRLAVDDAGNVYVCATDDADKGVYRMNPANPSANFATVLSGKAVHAIEVEGNTLNTLEDISVNGGTYNTYDISTIPAGAPTSSVSSVSSGYIYFANEFCTIRDDHRGGRWMAEFRGSDSYNFVVHINASGEQDFVINSSTQTSYHLNYTPRGTIAVSPAGDMLAIGSNSKVVVFSVSYNATTGVPSLTYLYDISRSGSNVTNTDGIAFDVAGNLYVVCATSERFYAYALPKADNRFETPAPHSSIITWIDPANPGILGDVNEDGVVNVMDATALIGAYLNNTTDQLLMSIADVNHDGVINVMDATEIINIYLNNR